MVSSIAFPVFLCFKKYLLQLSGGNLMKKYFKWVLLCYLSLCVLWAPNAVGEECKCEDLTHFIMEGYNVVINKANTIPEGKMPPGPFGPPSYYGVLPEYCRVDGEIDKRVGTGGKHYAIGFAIAMPQNWNGRFMFQGGGGLNGTVGDPIGAQGGGIPALARGLAVISSDTGHKSGGMGFEIGRAH